MSDQIQENVDLGDINTPMQPWEDVEFNFMFYCPRCRDFVLSKPDHCKSCGQALDWTGYSRDEKTQPE